MPTAALPWVINAYVLAFGGLLLFGGRAGDVFGQRRVLRWGLGIFTVASLANGSRRATRCFLVPERFRVSARR